MNPNRSTPRYLRRLMAAQACALFAVSSVWAQQVAQPAATNEPTNPQPTVQPARPTVAPAPTSATEEVVKMSPFEVQTSNRDIGYYAENTLAGSRLNTNVGDLAASITIVTKQQLVDTGSLNINDVFMYEANTEGAATYTPIFLNRSSARETLAGFSDDTGLPLTIATANRVRGVGAADTAFNNYPTASRVMFDTYNTQTIEINRGPNSLLFGTGSPAGIINQSATEAVFNKRKTEVQYRVGSWGSYRGSISHNQPLIDDKLAIYVAALYDSTASERKPSYDITRRQYGALTYQPFKKTKITAGFENYDNKNDRANSMMPRDFVTPWLQAGRPAYNSVTRMVTVLDTGRVLGPYVSSTRAPGWIPGTIVGGPATVALTSTTSPQFVPGIQFDAGRTAQFINQGTLVGFWNQNPSGVALNQPAAASRTAAQWLAYDDRPTLSLNLPIPVPNIPVLNGYTPSYGTWYIPGMTDKALYDYTKYNLLAPNYGTLGQKQYNIELQQELTDNLHLDVGWFRQEITEVDNYVLGQTNQQFSTWVDTNLVLPNGSPNPYFGSPEEYDTQADTFVRPEINNNYRVMLAYETDFTKNKGWTRWLGHHRFLGLWSLQRDITTNLRYRLSFDGGDTRFLPNTTTTPANNFNFAGSGNLRRYYYEGQGSNGVVQYSPGFWGVPGWGALQQNTNTGTIQTYNWTTAAWEGANVQFDSNLFYAGSNYGINDKVIESRDFAWQGYLWNDRIVPTLGWRRDNVKIRSTNFAGLSNVQEYIAGFAIPSIWQRLSNWNYTAGNTKTQGVVVYPLKWSSGSVSLHLNKSDNFNPPSTTNVDYLGNPRPKPVGQGKDYGVAVSLFDNKLVATLNWFDTSAQNQPATNASTALGRVSRMDTSSFRSWAEYVVRIRNGENPTDPLFANASARPLSGAEQDQIAAIMGVPYTWPTFSNGGSINGTQENLAKGIEASIIYNPLRNWNIKFTLGKQKSTYDQVAPEIDAWLTGSNAVNPNGRLAYWQAATAPDMPGVVFFQGNAGRQLSLRNFWNGYGFNADVYLENASGANPTWTSPANFYASAVAPEIAVAKALEGNQVPDERMWNWSLISTYQFQTGLLKGLSVGGGVRWSDRALSSYYGDLAHPNSTNAVVAPDITRPIYTPSEIHYDAWVAYTTKVPKIFGNKVGVRFQLNVYDLTENKTRLEVINFNYDGSPAGYRIIDPRRFAFTTTLDF